MIPLTQKILITVVLVAPAVVFLGRNGFVKAASRWEAAALVGGISLALPAVGLFWLMLLFPGMPGPFYLLSILLAAAIISVLAFMESRKKSTLEQFRKLNEILILSAILMVGTSLLLELSSFRWYFQHPLYGNDILEYGTAGRIHFRDRDLGINWNQLDSLTGFYHVSFHAPGVELLHTYELMLASVSHLDASDELLKGITPIFAILQIVWVFAFSVRRFGHPASIVCALTIPLCYVWAHSLANYHLDMIRIFFFTVSAICVAELAAKTSISHAEAFSAGLLCGLSALMHSIGFIAGGLLFFLIRDSDGGIRNSIFCALGFFFFGAAFYAFDIIAGKGWMFGVPMIRL